MFIKKNRLLVFLSLTIVVSFLFAACNNSTSNTQSNNTAPAATATATPAAAPAATTAPDGQKTFTKDELAKYDGKNGNPAYVAVDGVVYDVSKVKEWKNGKHEGYKAGLDLSKEIKAAPHGLSALDGVPVVGKYIG